MAAQRGAWLTEGCAGANEFKVRVWRRRVCALAHPSSGYWPPLEIVCSPVSKKRRCCASGQGGRMPTLATQGYPAVNVTGDFGNVIDPGLSAGLPV